MRDYNIIKNEYDTEKNDIEKSHDAETSELRQMIETIEEEENAKEVTVCYTAKSSCNDFLLFLLSG